MRTGDAMQRERHSAIIRDEDRSRLDFYEVDQAYVDELKAVDPLIPNVNYSTHGKFMCGILFSINGLDYFAPISSFKKSQRTNFLIKNRRGQVVGSVRFSFMFPIVELKRHVKDFSQEDEKRRNLLIEELEYCNKHARRIHAKAKHVYDTVTSGSNPALQKVCCDFRKLEQYVSEHYPKA